MGPWTETWQACKLLRGDGLPAHLDVAIMIHDVEELTLDPWELTVTAAVPHDLADRVSQTLTSALTQQPLPQGRTFSPARHSEHECDGWTRWEFSY